jgi:hypothetical protein
MALKTFWLNVRTAARLAVPTVGVDSPQIEPAEIAKSLARAAVWLTPKSVAGYREEDFGFLVDDRCRELSQSVNRFREVARQVPPDAPPTEEQLERAIDSFQRILGILRFDKYADADAFEAGTRIERYLAGQLPPGVSELRFETGENSHGAPALWVLVVFKEDPHSEDALLTNANAVRELLHAAVEELGIERWPYLRLRTEAELGEPVEN